MEYPMCTLITADMNDSEASHLCNFPKQIPKNGIGDKRTYLRID